MSATTTTTEPTLDRRAADYLAAVRSHLADLPPDERDDLLDDLESHVHEVAAATDGSLDDTLGPPATFAAELRASAGLAPAARRPGAPLDHLRRRTDALRHHPWARAVVAFLPELRPAWWVARGWLLVWLAAEATGGDAGSFPVPELWGNGFVGLVVTVPLVAWSVRLGRSPTPPRWRWAVNACAVLGAVLMMTAAGGSDAGSVYLPVDGRRPLSTGDGDPVMWWPDGFPVTDLDVYGPDGQLIDRVTVVDQDGRVLDVDGVAAPLASPDMRAEAPPDARADVLPDAGPPSSTGPTGPPDATGGTTTVPVAPVPDS